MLRVPCPGVVPRVRPNRRAVLAPPCCLGGVCRTCACATRTHTVVPGYGLSYYPVYSSACDVQPINRFRLLPPPPPGGTCGLPPPPLEVPTAWTEGCLVAILVRSRRLRGLDPGSNTLRNLSAPRGGTGSARGRFAQLSAGIPAGGRAGTSDPLVCDN